MIPQEKCPAVFHTNRSYLILPGAVFLDTSSKVGQPRLCAPRPRTPLPR